MFCLVQGLHGEVEQQRSEFDELLVSCDLQDTPFDQTHFESDVTALREQLAMCDKVCSYHTHTQVGRCVKDLCVCCWGQSCGSKAALGAA